VGDKKILEMFDIILILIGIMFVIFVVGNLKNFDGERRYAKK
jgi:hypothetical protein